MGRKSRKRPYHLGHVPLDMGRVTGGVRYETGPGGRQFSVRNIAAGTKEYRCPGCQQMIAVGTPHVVVWPDDGLGGVDDRRHWHSMCWKARDHGRYGR